MRSTSLNNSASSALLPALSSNTSSAITAATFAVVLAGGNGTRLGDLTRWECKPALPFGGKFRNIDFSLSNCLHSGIRRAAVVTQYKSQTLIQHLEEAWGFLPRRLGEFIDLWPAQQRLEPNWYRGTADAVYQNLDLLRAQNPQWILVLAGDHVYKMDYRRLLMHHIQSGATVTVASVPVPREEAASYGVLTLNKQGRIETFLEKPAPSELPPGGDTVLGSMGVYVFNAEELYERLSRDAQQSNSSHDFGRDLLPGLVAAGEAAAFAFTDSDGAPAYWRDVGTLDGYWQAHMELLERSKPFDLFDAQWPIFTQTRQLPPAQLLGGSPTSHVADALVSEGCVIDGATVQRSVLGPAVRVERESLLRQSVVLPDAQIGSGCRLHRTIVESGCIVPPGTVIGEDAAADVARFTVSTGGVVLVTAEALAREAVRQVA
jgi:glucose-1-phosphate adenylyltransferase